MEYLNLEQNERYRTKVNDLLKKAWGDVKIVVHGEWIDLSRTKAVICVENSEVIGAVHYYFAGDSCEILSLFSHKEHVGIGQKLMHLVLDECRDCGLQRLFLVTTNDNVRAFKFYQQFGMDLEEIRFNQLELSRRLKPQTPFVGDNGIPLKHELQFGIKI